LCVLFEIVNHGGRPGNAMRALARWRHPLASSEALVVLYRSMCPASHRRIRMVVEIVVDLPARGTKGDAAMRGAHRWKAVA